MAEKKPPEGTESGEEIIAKAKDFWEKNNKTILIVCAAIIIGIGGFYVYKNYFKNPKETKATELLFKAEEYYRIDSVNLALNGDGQYPGFLKVISQYGGTDAGNLACFYAGNCYIKLGENEKAVKYLNKFSTGSKPIQARAYKLLGDAYADMGKNKEALENYIKAAHHFEKDRQNSSEYLFMAAYFADKVVKDTKQAIELYKEVKEKYPRERGSDADNYLAQLGVYSAK